MFSERKTLVIITSLSALCVVLASFLVGQLSVEPRIVTINEPAAKPEPNKPDWLIKYPSLSFLQTQNDVTVVESNDPNTLFALKKIGNVFGNNIFVKYEFWQKNISPGMVKEIGVGNLSSCDTVSAGRDGDYVFTHLKHSPCSYVTSYLTYYDIENGDLDFILAYGEKPDQVIPAIASYKDKITAIHAEYEGDCTVPSDFVIEKDIAPKVAFTGVTLITGGVKKFFPNSEKNMVSCIMVPMETIVYGEYPQVNKAEVINDKFVFSTPFNISITIDPLKKSSPPIFK